MNIFLINHYAGSDKMGMEFRPYYLGKNWAAAGHDVTIVTCTFSHLRAKNPVDKRDFEEEYIDGIRYVWVNSGKYKRNDLKRVLNVLTFVKKLKKNAEFLAKKYRPDHVIASSTYPIDIYPAKMIADISGAKLFYEIHDLWPLTQIELYKMSEKNPFIRYLQKAEDFCYKNAGVISILPHADRHIKERGFSCGYTHIPNGILMNGGEIQNSVQREAVLKLKEKGFFTLLYLGGFTNANAIDLFLKFAPYLREDERIVLVGSGRLKVQFEERFKGNEKVVFLPPVEKERVEGVLNAADCLFTVSRKCGLYKYGVASYKLFDYMYSKTPVISAVEASNDPVGDSGCGFTVEPGNMEELREALDKIRALSETERREMGECGREYVKKHHDLKKLSEDFLKYLEK